MKKKLIAALLFSALLFSAPAPVYASEPSTETAAGASTESSQETAQETEAASLYDFQITINGELYQFPMSYEEFTSRGWEYDGDASMEISPNQYTSAEVFKNGDLTIYATIFNLGVNVVPVSEADIAGITLDSFYLEDTDLTASLPGGITMDSTIDDVIAAYGEPSSRYDGDTLTSLDYTYASYQDVSFSFDSESGAMTGLELRNLVASEEDGDAASEINEDAPEVVAQYQAPTELGTDLRACTLELEGTLYQLPAPVRVFLENGWTIVPEESDEYAAARSSAWVTLMKDNQSFRTLTTNYGDWATILENCFVTNVTADVYSSQFDLRLPGDITIGMSAEDLLSALDGYEYETEESSSFRYYTVLNYNSTYEGISISVNTEEGTVSTIDVTNAPDLEELYQ